MPLLTSRSQLLLQPCNHLFSLQNSLQGHSNLLQPSLHDRLNLQLFLHSLQGDQLLSSLHDQQSSLQLFLRSLQGGQLQLCLQGRHQLISSLPHFLQRNLNDLSDHPLFLWAGLKPPFKKRR